MSDTLAVELVIHEEKATVKLDNFGQKIRLVSDDINKIGGDTRFAGKLTTDFVALEKRTNDLRQSLEAITKTRLDSGNIGFFTREIVVAHERAAQLQRDIVNIRRELADPNRKSSIKFLTEELKAAETEADRLNRKLSTLPNSQTASGSARNGRSGGGRRGLSEIQRSVLEVADDFVPAGFNRPFNAVSKELLAVNAIGLTTALTFGAIAAAGYGIVKVTQNIREEAERQLRVQEQIAGAVNNQILSQKQGLENYERLLKTAADDRAFSRRLQDNSLDDLKRERATLEQLIKLTPATLPVLENGKVISKPNEDFERLTQRGANLNAQIEQTGFNNRKAANDSFNQRFDDFRKNQESAIESEKRLAEANKKRLEDVEKGKAKVIELGRTYESVYDSLYQKVNAANPFTLLFGEGEKAAKSLRETTRGLSGDVVSTFERMEAKAQSFKLLELKTANSLAALDLRQDASNFRNPFDGEKQKKEQEEFVKNFLRNNPNYLFLQNKNVLDDTERQNILKRFAPSALNEKPADRFNEFLTQKADLLYKPNQSLEQQTVSDKKFIGLTSGANPLDLSKDLRERAAMAREREADRSSKLEEDAKKERADDRKIRERLIKVLEKLDKTAEKGGLKAIESVVRIVDDTKGAVQLESSPSRSDVSSFYDPDFHFGGSGGLSNR